MNSFFRKFSSHISQMVGSPISFIAAFVVILLWILTGPIFKYSNTWQLIINTATTIITFLMVFVIQNTQNRDAKAIHIKLDELVRTTKGARNALVDVENIDDRELDKLLEEFKETREEYERKIEKVRLSKEKRNLK